MDAEHLRIKDDIPYIRFVQLQAIKDPQTKIIEFTKAYVDGNWDEASIEEKQKVDVLIAHKIRQTTKGTLSQTDQALFLLMTLGLSYTDAVQVPSRIAMAFMKQKTKIREKQVRQKIEMEQRIRESRMQPLPSQPISMFSAEVEAIIEKQKQKTEEHEEVDTDE